MLNLIKRKDGLTVAYRNGKELLCPFIAPYMSAGSGLQPKINWSPCSDMCVHFHHEKENVKLTCGNNAIFENVEVIEEITKPTLNILK